MFKKFLAGTLAAVMLSSSLAAFAVEPEILPTESATASQGATGETASSAPQATEVPSEKAAEELEEQAATDETAQTEIAEADPESEELFQTIEMTGLLQAGQFPDEATAQAQTLLIGEEIAEDASGEGSLFQGEMADTSIKYVSAAEPIMVKAMNSSSAFATKNSISIDFSAAKIPYGSNLSIIFTAILNAHPEWFYLNGQFFYWYDSTTGYITDVIFNSLLSCSSIAKQKAEFNAAVNAILGSLPASASMEEKMLLLHDIVASSVYYPDDLADYKYDAYSALVLHEAVCQGSALSYMYLLEKVGISSTVVTSNDINHAWNGVLLNGTWYQTDCTWDEYNGSGTVIGRCRHSHYLLSKSDMMSRHYGGTDQTCTNLKWATTSYGTQWWNKLYMPVVAASNGDLFWSDYLTGNIYKGDVSGNGTNILQVPPRSGIVIADDILYVSNATSIDAYQVSDFSKPRYTYSNLINGASLISGLSRVDYADDQITWYAHDLNYPYSYTSKGTILMQVPVYTVKFNTNGGSAVTAQSVGKNSAATKPKNPTLSGFSFGGWYKDSALKNAYDFSTKVTKNITLYAKWTLKTVSQMTPGNTSAGINVEWSANAGATGYEIYRKEGSGSYTKVKTVTGKDVTTWTDTGVTAGKVYTYKIRARSGSAASGYSTERSITRLSTPSLSSAVNSSTGITLKWGKVSGAANYQVFRTISGEKNWAKIAEGITAITYTDKTAQANISYDYYVRALSSATSQNRLSESSNIKTLYCVKPPVISSIGNGAESMTVRWYTVMGATAYRVERKVDSGSWVRVVSSQTATTYSDTDVTAGKTYSYRICAYNGNTRSAVSAEKSAIRLTPPSMRTPKNAATGITVAWVKVSGASSYSVYRRNQGTTSWTKLKSGLTTTSYLDTTATAGSRYEYSVRAVSGSTSSYYAAAKAVVRVTTPSMSTPKNAASSITVKWSAVTGATAYRVERKVDSGSWAIVVESQTETSYEDADVTSGKTYSYRTYAYNGNIKSAVSDEKSIVCLTPMTVSKVSNASTGLKVTWAKAAGATSYKLYRGVDGAKPKLLKSGLTSTSYTDTSAVSGKTYEYKVYACKDSASSTSGTSKSLLYLSAPKISSAAKISTGIRVRWYAVTGATEYKVYSRLQGSSKWTMLKKVTGTTYTDTAAVKGKTYEYRVSAVATGSTSAYSETKSAKR